MRGLGGSASYLTICMEVGVEEVGECSTSGRACLCIESITPQAIPSVPYYCGVFRYYTGVVFEGEGTSID